MPLPDFFVDHSAFQQVDEVHLDLEVLEEEPAEGRYLAEAITLKRSKLEHSLSSNHLCGQIKAK